MNLNYNQTKKPNYCIIISSLASLAKLHLLIHSNIVNFLPNSIPWQVDIRYIKSTDFAVKNELLRVNGPGKEQINIKTSFQIIKIKLGKTTGINLQSLFFVMNPAAHS